MTNIHTDLQDLVPGRKLQNRLHGHKYVQRTLMCLRIVQLRPRPSVQAMLQQLPDYTQCYVRLACIAQQCGHLQEATDWIERALQHSPDSPDALCLLGRFCLTSGSTARLDTCSFPTFCCSKRFPLLPCCSLADDFVPKLNAYTNDAGTMRLMRKDWAGASKAYNAVVGQKDLKHDPYARVGLATIHLYSMPHQQLVSACANLYQTPDARPAVSVGWF